MYFEIWSIWPANLGATFDSAKEAEDYVRYIVDQQGVAALNNLALFAYTADAEESGECVAENEAILTEITSRRIVEEFLEHIDASTNAIDEETSRFIKRYIASGTRIPAPEGTDPESWLKGFLSAALHNVNISVLTDNVNDYAIQTVTIKDEHLQKAS